eukprot:31342-Pelagococcus_subviridis.AAC.13
MMISSSFTRRAFRAILRPGASGKNPPNLPPLFESSVDGAGFAYHEYGNSGPPFPACCQTMSVPRGAEEPM